MPMPEFKSTPRLREKVKVWMSARISQVEIAKRLGICTKTLQKHFFQELETGASEIDGDHIMALHHEIVNKGNVAAFREFQQIKKHGMLPELLKEVEVEKPTKPEKLGKKEQQTVHAANPNPETTLGELMLRRRQQTVN